MNKIIFFNSFHNGDIHLGRSFVSDIVNKIKNVEYYYEHHNSSKLLKDLSNITFKKSTLFPYGIGINEAILKNDGDIYINTWIGQNNMHYVTNYGGCTFDAYYNLFSDIYKFLEIEHMYEEKNFYLPKINYKYYENIDGIRNIMNIHKNNILIVNQDVHSGQVQNFNFDPIIYLLSQKYKNINFFVTKKTDYLISLNKKNIFFTTDIININENDMNENSFLSTYCDIIVGRSSGVYCYCQTEENYLNDKKIFICFDNTITNAFWVDKNRDLFIKAEISGSPFISDQHVYSVISQQIDKRYKI